MERKCQVSWFPSTTLAFRREAEAGLPKFQPVRATEQDCASKEKQKDLGHLKVRLNLTG